MMYAMNQNIHLYSKSHYWVCKVFMEREKASILLFHG